MLNVLAGYDRLDIASVEHTAEDYVAALKQPVSGLRIGIARAPFFDLLDADVAKVVDDALKVIAKLTRSMNDAMLPSKSLDAVASKSTASGASPAVGVAVNALVGTVLPLEPAALGTSDTSGTKPASIVADAITILSTAWSDSNAGNGIGNRLAGNTTVNAAFLAGIVQSDGSHYSGGVENFPRFLEDWSGDTFTYNGSMVVMFDSRYAIVPWGGADVYSPPSRNWFFDVNFMDATKLPPGTPSILTVIRGSWAIVSPNSVL